MSAHYSTEPAPTASATLNTTFGPLHISLFAKQTPLTCKNFLQHCLDGYYVGTIFHRVVPDFIIQGGDPTGTGSGGTSIYEYPEFEYDPESREPDEKVILKDELHSRLRFNRRGLVGMAKSEDGSYGSQFFITLANTERELNGKCTLFGRIEGDSIYNVLKIADAERVEGSERPVYPVKITSCEIGEQGPLAGKLLKRQLTAPRVPTTKEEEKPAPKKKKKTKAGKALLSFGAEEGDEDVPILPAKPKFNVQHLAEAEEPSGDKKQKKKEETMPPPTEATKTKEPESRKRPRSPSPPMSRDPHKETRHRPRSPNPLEQLPLVDPEVPSRSPPGSPPARQSILSRTNAQIDALKNSMRRNTAAPASDIGHKKSALEALIPETAIRGRKRPTANGGPRGSNTNGTTGFSSASESESLRLFNAFKAKLESADSHVKTNHTSSREGGADREEKKEKKKQLSPQAEKSPHRLRDVEEEAEDEEAQICDLHFIANCQSCKSWDVHKPDAEAGGALDDEHGDDDQGWLTHQLRFGKDTLGKDLKWKHEHPDDLDSLVVIDPREREKELLSRSGRGKGKGRGLERDRERERKSQKVGETEWDRRRR